MLLNEVENFGTTSILFWQKKEKQQTSYRWFTRYQKSSSLKLMSQLETATKVWGSTPDVKVKDLISALTSPGRQPVMTAVRIQGNPKKGESVDNMKKTHPDAIVVIDSMALFKGDKLVGFLSVEDTRNYLWTQNQIENTSISVPCGENRYAAIRITDSKTKRKGPYQKWETKDWSRYRNGRFYLW